MRAYETDKLLFPRANAEARKAGMCNPRHSYERVYSPGSGSGAKGDETVIQHQVKLRLNTTKEAQLNDWLFRYE